MLFRTAPGLSGPNGAAPDRTRIFGEVAWARRADVYANRNADKLEVSDPAILLKPHNEAKAKLALWIVWQWAFRRDCVCAR